MSFPTRSMLPAIALAALMVAPQIRTALAEDAHHPDTAATATQTQPAPTPPPGQEPARSAATGTTPMIGQGLGSGAILQPTAPQTGGQPGMMMGSQDSQSGMMGSMGPMMRQMMMGPSSGMGLPFEHIEGRIAFLKAELKITEAQAPSWNAFADALRTSAKAHQGMAERMSTAGMPTTWPDRLALQQTVLSARLDALKALEAAAKPLYATLTAEQKALADRLFAGPMGMM